MRRVPWLGMPTTSPAWASSASERSWAKKNCGACRLRGLAGPHLLDLHPADELARAQPHERDAVAVVRVHVGLHLENESRHVRFRSRHQALVGRLRARRRRHGAERIEQIADAKVLERAAEEHRRQMALAERRHVEALARFAHQIELALDGGGVEVGIERGDLGYRHFELAAARRCRRRADGRLPVSTSIVPTKSRPRPIGQVIGAAVERERLLDLVQQVERVAALAVHLVDEGDDRNIAQPADLEQLARARLDALRGVDHHDGGVDRGERPVGVLGEVLVAGRIEQIEHAVRRIRRSSPR